MYRSDYFTDAGDTHVDKFNLPRFVTATVTGVLLGAYLIFAAQAGVKFNYRDENPLEQWGLVFWGSHYVIRAIWSISTTIAASYVAGIIARRDGALVGVISALPTVFVWFAAVTIWLFMPTEVANYGYDNVSTANKIMSILVPVLTVIVAFLSGKEGEKIGRENSDFFDSRPRSFLGIPWYHFFWIGVFLYVVVLESAWAIDYGISMLVLNWADAGTIVNLVSGMFLIGIFSTLYLTGVGLWKAYDYLSDMTTPYSGKETAKGVAKYALGYFALAMLGQALISLLGYGLAKLFS